MPIEELGLNYAVNDKPPFTKLCLSAIQQVTLLSVYLVLVVIICRAAHLSPDEINNEVGMGMIVLAIGTALQSLRPPFGSGYLASPVVSAIYLKASIFAAKTGGLGLVLGMTIFSGLLEMIFSRFIHRLRVIFPPGISGFIITIVGIDLGTEGISQFLDVTKSGVTSLGMHIFIASLTLSVMIGLSVWSSGVIRLICSFAGLAVGFLFAFLVGGIPTASLAQVGNAPYFALPHFNLGPYHFSPAMIVPFFVGGIAAALRTIGTITTCQKINTVNWNRIDMKSIEGGIFADGLGCTIAGLLGISGINTAPSLVGVSQASGATSRYISFATAILLLIIAFFPKISALFLIIPMSVVGPALMFTGSFMIVGGIQVMTSRTIDTRMTYVIGFALLFGLSRVLFPDFYNALPYFLQAFSSTSLSISVIIALLLHLVFRIGIQRKANIAFEGGKYISNEELSEFILKKGKIWKVNKEVIERTITTTQELLKHLIDAQVIQGDISIEIIYDQLDFVVKIKYQGELLQLPFVNQNKKSFLEEESFSYGLVDFLTGVHPDKFERYMENNEAHINLYFNT